MANEFPGMDQVLEFLRQQKELEAQRFNRNAPKPPPSMSNVAQPAPSSMSNVPTKGPLMSEGHQFPEPTRAGMANVPAGAKAPAGPASAGNFASSLGKAGPALRALGATASRVSWPLAVGAALQPVATAAGEGLGNIAHDIIIPEEMWKRPAKISTKSLASKQGAQQPSAQPAQTPTAVDQSAELAGLPAQSSDQQARPTASPEVSAANDSYKSQMAAEPRNSAAIQALLGQPVTLPAAAAPSAPTESTSGTADEILRQLDELLSAPPATPQSVAPRPESTATIGELSKDRNVDQPAPKSRLGRMGRYVQKAATNFNGGNYDPTRYDAKQLELSNAKRQFTPQEQMRGGVALKDIEGADATNRNIAADMAKSGGFSTRDSKTFDALMEMYKMAGGDESKIKQAQLEHQNKMAQIGAEAGAKSAGEAAQTQQKMQADAIVRYLDVVPPEVLFANLGWKLTDQDAAVLKMARLGDDPAKQAVTRLIEQRLAQQGQASRAGAKAPKLNTNSTK